MTDHIKHENSADHESFEHQDLKAANLVYFLLTLGVVTILCMFALQGLYAFLDQREKASQPAVNPLVTNVPEDTRHVAPGYPQTAFPSPKLEEDERGQLNGIKLQQDNSSTATAGSIKKPERCIFPSSAPWICWCSVDCPSVLRSGAPIAAMTLQPKIQPPHQQRAQIIIIIIR